MYKRGRRRLPQLDGLVGCVLALCFQTLGFSQTYVIRDLGYPGDWYSEAHGINLFGNVVGEYEVINSPHVNGFLYQAQTDARTNLGNLSGPPYAVAYGINDTNQVVGESNSGSSTHAFKYSNGSMTDLGTLAGNYSSAHAMNKSGQIVGESSTPSMGSPIHAALWSGGTNHDLGALAGNYSSAFGINNSGAIVGESEIVSQLSSNIVTHAFVATNVVVYTNYVLYTTNVVYTNNIPYTNTVAYTNTVVYTNYVMQDLGTLPGGDDYSAAFGINDSGVIVGESNTKDPVTGVTTTHAFIYQNGVMSDLGTLGGNVSSASAINNSGQVAGYATDANNVSCAFLYNGTSLVNLNTQITPGSGFTNLASADAINDAGQIAGSGFMVDSSYNGYLLTPAGPLVLSITTPPAHSIFFAPATFAVGAYLVDVPGTVTNMQFLLDGNVIRNATFAACSVAVSNLTAGTHLVTAVASDDAGVKATNFISVSVIDSPPTIAIISPAANATFASPGTFLVSATASNPGGAVTNVQFLVNTNVIGNASFAPYSALATNVSAGTNILSAVAWSDAGLAGTNSISVTVSTNAAPSIAIVSPALNATFQAPANFVASAFASDPVGTVTNVQFLLNGTVISNVTAAPYRATVTDLAASSYTLAAVLSDDAGLTTIDSISITVTNYSLTPIRILKPSLNKAGFSFSFITQTGITYYGQFATPLSGPNNWLTFTNLIGNGCAVRVTNAPLTNAQGYYRVMGR